MKPRTLLNLALLSLLLLTACNKSDPLPGAMPFSLATARTLDLYFRPKAKYWSVRSWPKSAARARSSSVKFSRPRSPIPASLEAGPRDSSSSTPPRAPLRRAFPGKTGSRSCRKQGSKANPSWFPRKEKGPANDAPTHRCTVHGDGGRIRPEHGQPHQGRPQGAQRAKPPICHCRHGQLGPETKGDLGAMCEIQMGMGDPRSIPNLWESWPQSKPAGLPGPRKNPHRISITTGTTMARAIT